jgi:putative glutamine amidotransferase
MNPPLIGITPDVIEHRGRPACRVMTAYAERVARAGGLPVVLSPDPALVSRYTELLDGLVLSGGDDPRTEEFGVPTHPSATPVFAQRQAFEVALLRAWGRAKPALGVCLGMQFMGLVAGGRLDQHLPETTPTAGEHWEGTHTIRALAGWRYGTGAVHSMHRQAIASPGSLAVIAEAPDGVVEAIGDPDAPFYLGVQWHPERTEHPSLGQRLFDELVRTARAGARA